MIILVTHAALVNDKVYEAPSNTMRDNLLSLQKDLIFIRHYMNWERQSEVFKYTRWELISKWTLLIFRWIAPIRYITEILSTFIYILFSWYKNITYIGVDPLNSFTGYLLKKLRRLDRNIFYTPDYSPKRFSNSKLNSIYHFVDRTCVFGADEVWNVSFRITAVRKDMWLTDNNIFLPNVPGKIPEEILNNEQNKYHLITLWMISEQLDFIWIFEAIKILKDTYPKILLKIIWNGPKEEEYKKYIKDNGSEEYIQFLGYMSHADALREISTSGIWLALYNWKWWFNYYGDSMKCREFFAFWLPVLTTDTHSTVEDIISMNWWIVSLMDTASYVVGINKIFNEYEEFSWGSNRISQKYNDFYMQKIIHLC